MWIMAVGAAVGAADKIFGNKLGLGEKFDEGFHAMGPLALGMTGIVCLTPVICDVLGPVISPALKAIGADPALFGGITANDMGGYALATALAEDPQAGLYTGLFVSAMFGGVLVFHFPVGFGIVEKEDARFYAHGLLFGIITIPVGTFLGGFLAGFGLPMLIHNTMPILVLAIILAGALKYKQQTMIKICTGLGWVMTAISYTGMAAAAFEYMTGIAIIPGMTPILEALELVTQIGVVLLGTFPVLSVLSRALEKPLTKIGSRAGLDSTSVSSLIFGLANPIPVYPAMKHMKKRGIIINAAWIVSASASLGDHLGFTAGVNPEYIGPVIAGKITAGALAVIIAYLATRDME